MEITINVVNRGSRSVNMADPRVYGACKHAFIVLDAADQVVDLPAMFCIDIGYVPVELAPGEGIAYRDRWTPGSVGRYRLVSRVLGDNKQELGSKPPEVSVEVRAP